jgi:HSP20 family molecular chaperone IbpA
MDKQFNFDTSSFLGKLNLETAKKISDAMEEIMIHPRKSPFTIPEMHKHRKTTNTETHNNNNVVQNVNESGILILLNVAGYKKENIQLWVTENVLNIAGAEGGLSGVSTFTRTFDLPPQTDLSKATVELNNGVLEVFIPKPPKEVTRLTIK